MSGAMCPACGEKVSLTQIQVMGVCGKCDTDPLHVRRYV